MRRRILTDKEQGEIFNLNYSDEELVKEFTIESADLVKVSRINKDWNKVGYLLQYMLMKKFGYTMKVFDGDIPNFLIEYIRNQLGIGGVDLKRYSRTNRLEDLKSITKELGYKKFKLTEDVKQEVFKIALTNVLEREMMMDLIYYLKREKIALTAIKTMEKLLWDANKDVENYIYTKIVEQIEDTSMLDTFLEVTEGRFSDYNIVKNGAIRGKEDILNKINILKKYDLEVELSFIPYRKLQAVYGDTLKCTREKLLRFRDGKKRLAYLVIYVKQELKRLEDELIIIDREEEKNRYKKIEVTEQNILRVYNRFIDEVVLKKEEYKEHILVSTFLDLLIGESYKGYSENEKGYFLEQEEIVYIDRDKYSKFIDSVIVGNYTNAEKNNLIAVSDKLQDIRNRRAGGTYYTPKIWVDEAHKMLEQELGIDWKDKYVVWECSSGRGNLVNGYSFKELYSSTLNAEDLEYVKEGVKFQLDFLNDDIEKSHKIPPKLVQALKEDKSIVLFINPPYKSDNEVIEVEGIRYSTPTTKVGKHMLREGLGVASNQLYTQFLMQIVNIKKRYNLLNVYIAIFSPTTYIEGERFSNLRDLFLSEFDFQVGMLFSAKNFHGVYGNWDVSFTIWSSGECKNKNEFLYIQKEVDIVDKISTKGIRTLSNKDRLEG